MGTWTCLPSSQGWCEVSAYLWNICFCTDPVKDTTTPLDCTTQCHQDLRRGSERENSSLLGPMHLQGTCLQINTLLLLSSILQTLLGWKRLHLLRVSHAVSGCYLDGEETWGNPILHTGGLLDIFKANDTILKWTNKWKEYTLELSYRWDRKKKCSLEMSHYIQSHLRMWNQPVASSLTPKQVYTTPVEQAL